MGKCVSYCDEWALKMQLLCESTSGEVGNLTC